MTYYDCVLGNPPYQDPTNPTVGNPLWPKFVQLGSDILREGGSIGFITPTTWMNKSKRGAWKSFAHLDLDCIFPSVKSYFEEVGGQGLNFTAFIAHKIIGNNKSKETLILGEDNNFSLDANHLRLPTSYIKWSQRLFELVNEANRIGYYQGHPGASKPSINSSHYSYIQSNIHKHPIMYSGAKRRKLMWIDREVKDHYNLKLICPVSGSIYDSLTIGSIGAGRQTEYICGSESFLEEVKQNILHPISKKLHRFFACGNYNNLISSTPIHPHKLMDFSDVDCIIDLPQFKISKDERAKRLGEVFTPLPLCKKIIRNIPSPIIRNPSSLYIDFSAGEGNFLVALRDYLRDLGQTNVEERIYAVDIDEKNVKCLKSKGFTNTKLADALSTSLDPLSFK